MTTKNLAGVRKGQFNTILKSTSGVNMIHQ